MAVKTKAVSEREIERVTVETTVATKAVAHPTDSHLMLRAIEWLNRAADKVGVKLRQSYLRLGRHARREVARLLHTGGHSQAMRHLHKMRTWVGRLLRDLERKTKGKPAAEPPIAVTNARAAGGQFVLGAKMVPGTPRDGNTLATQIDQVAALTSRRVRRAYVDRGYRGHKVVSIRNGTGHRGPDRRVPE